MSAASIPVDDGLVTCRRDGNIHVQKSEVPESLIGQKLVDSVTLDECDDGGDVGFRPCFYESALLVHGFIRRHIRAGFSIDFALSIIYKFVSFPLDVVFHDKVSHVSCYTGNEYRKCSTLSLWFRNYKDRISEDQDSTIHDTCHLVLEPELNMLHSIGGSEVRFDIILNDCHAKFCDYPGFGTSVGFVKIDESKDITKQFDFLFNYPVFREKWKNGKKIVVEIHPHIGVILRQMKIDMDLKKTDPEELDANVPHGIAYVYASNGVSNSNGYLYTMYDKLCSNVLQNGKKSIHKSSERRVFGNEIKKHEDSKNCLCFTIGVLRDPDNSDVTFCLNGSMLFTMPWEPGYLYYPFVGSLLCRCRKTQNVRGTVIKVSFDDNSVFRKNLIFNTNIVSGFRNQIKL